MLFTHYSLLITHYFFLGLGLGFADPVPVPVFLAGAFSVFAILFSYIVNNYSNKESNDSIVFSALTQLQIRNLFNDINHLILCSFKEHLIAYFLIAQCLGEG